MVVALPFWLDCLWDKISLRHLGWPETIFAECAGLKHRDLLTSVSQVLWLKLVCTTRPIPNQPVLIQCYFSFLEFVMMFLWPRTLMNTCFIAGFIVFCFQVCRCWLLQLGFISFLSARRQSYWLSWCLSLVLRLVLWIQVSEPFRVISRFGDSTMRKSRSYEIVTSFVLLLRWHGLTQSDYASSTPSSCQSGLGMVVNTNFNHKQPIVIH